MGLSILTFIISIFAYIADFLNNLFKNMAGAMVAQLDLAFSSVFNTYASDLSGAGPYAPLLFVATIAFGAMLSVAVLSMGKMVEDFE